MNSRKAKALRRAAIAASKEIPGHETVTYKDIVRQTVTEHEVVDESILDNRIRFLRRLVGKKTTPKTKRIEKVLNETRQTVLASGWKFILRRFKSGIRRKKTTHDELGIPNPLRGTRSLAALRRLIGAVS